MLKNELQCDSCGRWDLGFDLLIFSFLCPFFDVPSPSLQRNKLLNHSLRQHLQDQLPTRMRNFVLLASLLVTMFSPSIVSGAPIVAPSTNPGTRLSRRTPANQLVDTPQLEQVGLAHSSDTTPGGHANDSDTAGHSSHGQEDPKGPKYKYGPPNTFAGEHDDSSHQRSKRADDTLTAGGNAYSGSTGDVSSGDVTNDAGSGTITNNGGSKRDFLCSQFIEVSNGVSR